MFNFIPHLLSIHAYSFSPYILTHLPTCTLIPIIILLFSLPFPPSLYLLSLHSSSLSSHLSPTQLPKASDTSAVSGAGFMRLVKSVGESISKIASKKSDSDTVSQSMYTPVHESSESLSSCIILFNLPTPVLKVGAPI